MSLLVALPIVIPMGAGALSLVYWRSLHAQRGIALAGTSLMLIASLVLFLEVWEAGVLVLPASDWPAPFGIMLVADVLSAVMALMTSVLGLAAAVYSMPTVRRGIERAGYHPLMHLVLAGVAGAFLTGDIFNLYVWFEVLLLASFALLAMGGERAQMAGALHYVVLNLVSSALFLTATGLLYGLAGTLNMADLSVKLAGVDSGKVTTVATLFLVSFGIKAASFPLFFWLPASYHTPPVAVSALFAGLLTKVGLYALYRSFTLIFTQEVGYTHEVLKWMAAGTMLVGVLGAIAQVELRRALSFLHVSQLGYVLLGLALYTPLAVAAGVFYIVHHMVMMSNLFFLSGAVQRLRGTQRFDEMGGLWKEQPWLSLVFLVPALSIAGVPPLSGFWAKFVIIKAAILSREWAVTTIALVSGALTLYVIVTIWNEAFWKAAPRRVARRKRQLPVEMWSVIGLLAVFTLAIGLGGEPLLAAGERAAGQLLMPTAYIEAVLGPGSGR